MSMPSEIIFKLEKQIKLSKLFYTYYTGFSPLLGEEIIYRSNLDSNMRTSELTNSDLENLDRCFDNITNEILKPGHKYRLYRTFDNDILDFHCIFV